VRAFVLLACTTSIALAQPPADPAPSTHGWSVLLGPGVSILSGAPARANGGGGIIGLASERPLGTRVTGLTLRSELLAITTEGDITPGGDDAEARTTLSSQRFVTGVGVRRYGSRAGFVGVGATVSFGHVCFVDLPPRSMGAGESVECLAAPDLRITPVAQGLGGTLSAGLARGRWEFALRYDQGFTPIVRTDGGSITVASVGAVVHHRFARRVESGGPDASRPRAAPPLAGQVRAGMLGWAGGLVAGMLVGGAISDGRGEDWTPLLTGLLGTFVGTPVGVHWYGARHGTRANPIPTVIGTMLGAFGGPAAPYTMPLGAVIGYNTTSRER